MIGIAGIARAGKDTLALALKPYIEDEIGKEVRIFSFAYTIKRELDDFLIKSTGISAFEPNTQKKNIIRPMLVAYGEMMKTVNGRDFWSRKTLEHIESEKLNSDFFPIIPDTRFDYEADTITDQYDGLCIHISRVGNEIPANETEAQNDPKVASRCFIRHAWPTFYSSNEDSPDNHANILWQMIPQETKDKWKKI